MANSNEILEIIDDIFSNENNNKAYGITSLISINDLLNYAQNYSGSQERRGKLADECSAKNYRFSDKELIDIVKCLVLRLKTFLRRELLLLRRNLLVYQ